MDEELEARIGRWRAALEDRAGLPAEDVQELADHLRDEVEGLLALGLSGEEALLVAARRIGDINEVARELAVIDADRAWLQPFEARAGEAAAMPATGRETAIVVVAALAAAALGKVPRLFGIGFLDQGIEVYLRNTGLFVIPILMLAYYLRRRFSPRLAAFLAVLVAAGALAANAYPYQLWGATSLLVAIHLPLLLWLGLGLAYAGDEWRTVRMPLDFVRFTGEAFLYGVLILCGGVVFVGVLVALFSAVGVRVEEFAVEYLGYSIALATPVVAAYLVQKKRSLIENLAPVLARIFIPLFLVMMVAFIGLVALQGRSLLANREVLILMDLLLVLVVGMVMYDLSARRDARPGLTLPHALNLALIVAALVIDCIAPYAIAARVAEYGVSPNKAAALGENILLAINLAGLAASYLRVAARKATFEAVLAWQVRYLPAYLAWMAVVVFLFPPAFGYR